MKQTFAPASPPTTVRATRASGRKRAQEEKDEGKSGLDVEVPGVKKKKGSPFDGWARTKVSPGVSTGKGKKREGETLEKGGKGTKRVKGN